jgi:hypothetical protein
MFEHLKCLDPNGGTAWMDLPMIAPGAAVELKFAGEGNPGYFNALLARAGKRARKVQQKGGPLVDASMLAENRNEDRELYPVHILVDWRGIQVKTGTGGFMDVSATPENRKEFCAKLPDWIFDRIRDFASRPERFVRDGDEAPPDGAEVAGNS